MSKQVKDLITRELAERFKDVDAVAVFNPRGINAIRNNEMRRRFHEKGVHVTVVKNTLARRAVTESRLRGFEALLDGPSAVVFGEASIAAIARMLLDEKKQDDRLELRGVFFDGEVYSGEEGVSQISRLPTREEAIGRIVAAMLSPARKLAGILNAPGANLASILKTIEEKAIEKEGAPAEAPASA